MNDHLFSEYYDKIYSTKNYKEETTAILQYYKGLKSNVPGIILDVGCGTGNHDLYFAMEGCSVVGCDIDCEEIRIAKEKIKKENISNVSFFCKDVELIELKDFDLVVSLFNVINYICEFNYLDKFFNSISRKLNEKGIFIFDCWNGIAALLDPPLIKESEVEIENKKLMIKTVPEIDYMEQIVDVKNAVQIKSESEIKFFEFGYKQRLWSPAILKELLLKNELKVLNIYKAIDFSTIADYKTWKIMFACQKN